MKSGICCSVLLISLLLSACANPDLETLSQWRVKADQAYQAGDYPKALQYYEKLSKAVPREAELWYRLGNTHARMQRDEDAVKAYREAVVRDTHFSKAWYNAGLSLLRASSATFSESLQYIPESDPVYKISASYNQKLLQLIEEQNTALAALNQKSQQKPIDVKSVEMIILDGKPGSLSNASSGSVTHEDLLQQTAPDAEAMLPPVVYSPEKTEKKLVEQANDKAVDDKLPPEYMAQPVSPSDNAIAPAP
jgi:tetratricopeptide (TPR) repeat protein